MLVEPAVGRHDDGAGPPVALKTIVFPALLPQQRVALAVEDDDVRARTMAVALLVHAGPELGDVGAHAVVGEVDLDVAATAAAVGALGQLHAVDVGYEVRLPDAEMLAAIHPTFAAEIALVIGEAAAERMAVVEH